MNDKPVVTSNITISYKSFVAAVTEACDNDGLWHACHNRGNTIITAHSDNWDDLKKQYAISVDSYLDWIVENESEQLRLADNIW